MANNLRALRKARGLHQSEAASALGTTLSQYAKLERGDRRLSDVWIERAASAYGIDAGEVVASVDAPLPVLGSIEAGCVVRWLAGAAPVPETRGGLTIAAGALSPFFDGATLVTRCRRIALPGLQVGRPYLVLVDRWLLRTIQPASRGTWHLIGCNIAPSFDVTVAEAIECDGMSFGAGQ